MKQKQLKQWKQEKWLRKAFWETAKFVCFFGLDILRISEPAQIPF